MARDQQIMIRLTDEIKEELQRYAENYGLTMSALGAYIIGQWVYQQKRLIEPLIEPLVNSQGGQFRQVMEKYLGTLFTDFEDMVQEKIK